MRVYPPRRVLVGHSHRQLSNFSDDTVAACAASRRHPFTGNELLMPAPQGVGRRDRGDVAKQSAAESVRQGSEPSPVGVGETKAPGT